MARLREIGIDYEDITKYCRLDTMSYISALLRYVDYKDSIGAVENIKTYTFAGLPYGKYDVSEFEVII